MNITNLNALLSVLRAAENHPGGMPAGAMRHIQKAIERLEKKVRCIERVLSET